jgi:lipopolysaccharide export system permease protein
VFRIFDRYLITNFLVPFVYALFILVAIWLVYDLGVHANDFQEAQLSFKSIAAFYLIQLPFVILNCMPLCVLLGLLYMLTRMSRRNEIVSMLSAGVSVSRLLMPLIVMGLFLTVLMTFLNYDLAPKGSDSTYLLDEIVKGRSKKSLLDAYVFPNRREHRIWYAQQFNTKTEQMTNAQVTQMDDNGIIQSKMYGATVSYDGARKVWIFFNGKLAEMDSEGNVTNDEYFDRKEVSTWSETPWRLASGALKGKYMTVPQLQQYLEENSDFPPASLADYRTQFWTRFSLAWNALVIILVASPLCVVFSRRGSLAGVAGGLVMFLALYISSFILPAFGQGAIIPPALAAWGPVAFFLVLGLILLYRRSTNRPIPFMN